MGHWGTKCWMPQGNRRLEDRQISQKSAVRTKPSALRKFYPDALCHVQIPARKSTDSIQQTACEVPWLQHWGHVSAEQMLPYLTRTTHGLAVLKNLPLFFCERRFLSNLIATVMTLQGCGWQTRSLAAFSWVSQWLALSLMSQETCRSFTNNPELKIAIG